MAEVSSKALISTLNDVCTKTLEAAAGLCLSRTNYHTEVEHWVAAILDRSNTDLHAVLKSFGVNSSKVLQEVTDAIGKLKTGNGGGPLLSNTIFDLVREAWVLASVEYKSSRTRTGHLLLALLADRNLSQVVSRMAPSLSQIKVADLKKDLEGICADTVEADTPAAAQATAGQAAPGAKVGGKTPNLDQFTIDLTERAKQGKIDPVLGRDKEIRQITDILTRRRQNNPILTGEAGVGKTAVVEGFAIRVAQGDVPPALQGIQLRTLDLSLLQAGAGVKGEFENRLQGVIEEVNASVTPIILFIDEAHMMIGAGGSEGQGDAANLLKPALARGELRTIAATTQSEYKKYFERDAALARRFQVVKVDEPDEDRAIQMMQGLVETLQAHHGIEVLQEAVEDSVRLSHRYISGRQLPDKSVSLLDTACARVAIGHTTIPPAVEDRQREIDAIDTSLGILGREQSAGGDHGERIEKLNARREAVMAEYETLKEQWNQELELVTRIRDTRKSLGDPESEVDRDAAIASLKEDGEKLTGIQGENPLLQACVDAQAVAEVVAAWTGIPVGRMVSDEIRTVLELDQAMKKMVVGQDHAMDTIAEIVRTSRANLKDPGKPIGVFFLVGPSGVGKTETAITLAELLYGGEQNMTVFNMAEFKEEHKVATLMGPPPGYVGSESGGVLTEAVRRKPYSVILLDEMEKAHDGVQDVFYQVFDKGYMMDGQGVYTDFKNTLILMTSNAATETIMSLCGDPELIPGPQEMAEALMPELQKSFRPAFLGRVTVVPYFPLQDEVMRKIAVLKLGKIAKRVRENYEAEMEWTDAVLDHIVARCTEVDSGARNVDKILSNTMLPEMSKAFLGRMADGETITRAKVDVRDEAFAFDLG